MGALLCGGKSRRMGEDKAFLEVGGEVLWRRGVRVFEEAGAERVMVSANADQGPRMDTNEMGRVVLLVDPPGRDDPLSAMVGCLEAAEGMPLVALAVDMPGMTAGFLADRLLAEAGLERGRFFVGREGRSEPFGALYPAGMLEIAKGRVAAGDFSLTGWVKEGQHLGLMEEVRLEPGEEKFFANLNTPASLRDYEDEG